MFCWLRLPDCPDDVVLVRDAVRGTLPAATDAAETEEVICDEYPTDPVEEDRPNGKCPAAASGPGNEGGLCGSSNVGGGKTGELGALPVPDGPPPPTRRLTPLDLPPLGASKAPEPEEITNCCCRAKSSRPLVT